MQLSQSTKRIVTNLWRLKIGAPPVANTVINHPVLLHPILSPENLTVNQNLAHKNPPTPHKQHVKTVHALDTSVIRRFRPSTSSSPGFSSPPGLQQRRKPLGNRAGRTISLVCYILTTHSLKKVVPSCSSNTWGSLCSWTMRTPSTVLRIPILSNSSRILWNRAATDPSFSYKGSLVPNV